MFQSIRSRTPEQAAADAANLQWQADRRATRPQATVDMFAGSSRVPEFAKNDPAQVKAQHDAERRNLERLAQLTKKEKFAARKTVLTKSWHSPEMRTLRQGLTVELATYLDALMEQADSKVPERMFSAADWTYVIGLAKDNFNCDLESRNLSSLTPEEGLALVHFCRAQNPPLYLGSESNLSTAFECLKALGVIRFAEPEVLLEPEPGEPEKNPYRWDDNPRSDYAIWDRQHMADALRIEMSPEFRAGAKECAEQLGVDLYPADMHRLMQACAGLPIPLKVEAVKRVALKLFGNVITRDPEDHLSSLEYLRAHNLGTSVQREGR